MFITRASRYRPQRRGVILIVVLAMLTLFAILGISFVLVAQAQADSARLAKDSEDLTRPDMEAEAAFYQFLGQFIYGVSDTDNVGIYSPLRGQELARNMYGAWDGVNPSPVLPALPPPPFPINDKPYTGTGRMHTANSALPAILQGATAFANASYADDAFLMNFMYFPVDGFLRDPERIVLVNNPLPPNTPPSVQSFRSTNAFPVGNLTPAAAGRGVYTGGFAVPYTYPDHNNFYLGMIRPGKYVEQLNANDVAAINNANPKLVPRLTFPLPPLTTLSQDWRGPAVQNYTLGLVTPSFHRNYLFGPLDATNVGPGPVYTPGTTLNPNWVNVGGKYLTLRPRPIEQITASDAAVLKLPYPLRLDQLTLAQQAAVQAYILKQQAAGVFFPYPQDGGGDVKNLDWLPGGADSLWLDINAPVMQTRDGRKFKMLVAPLILELDSRLNLNVVGNIMNEASKGAATGTLAHHSDQGWGTWEVNPSLVLNANATEWRNIFLGLDPQTGSGRLNPQVVGGNTIPARTRGRYDNNLAKRQPLASTPPGGNTIRGWAQVDYNGINDNTGAAAGAWNLPISQTALPASNGQVPYFAFPFYPAATFGNGNSGGVNELTNHAELYNPFRPLVGNRTLPISSMAQLLRYGGSGSEMLTSDLLRLLPLNLAPPTTATVAQLGNATIRRQLVTLHSCDLDRPAATPYIWDPTDATTRLQGPKPGTNATQWTLTNNQPISFPNLNQRWGTTAAQWTTQQPFAPQGPPPSEFDANTWRSLSAAIGRLNLNRKLTDYPSPDKDPKTGAILTGQVDLTKAENLAQVNQANADRQQFALDIFNALRMVTGALDVPTASAAPYGTKSPEYEALRYLAQLAVNIVDYIDSDGYSTVFLWDGPNNESVFGFELPRLLINEAYAQYDNDNTAVMASKGLMGEALYQLQGTANFNVNVWLELMNPLPDETAISTIKDTTAWLQWSGVPGTGAAATVGQPYQILLCQPPGSAGTGQWDTTSLTNLLQDPANTMGDPNFGNSGYVQSTMSNWNAAGVMPPNPPTQVQPLPLANRFSSTFTTNPATGFYVIGPTTSYTAAPPFSPDPSAAKPGQNPGLTTNYLSPQMTYPMKVTATAADTGPPPVTAVLQRLANPILQWNDPKQPKSNPNPNYPYNPYVTVDYVELKNDPPPPSPPPPLV